MPPDARGEVRQARLARPAVVVIPRATARRRFLGIADICLLISDTDPPRRPLLGAQPARPAARTRGARCVRARAAGHRDRHASPLAAPAAGGHPGGRGRPAAARSSLGSSCSSVWR